MRRFLLLAFAAGCSPSVQVDVLRPAEIPLPKGLERVVVADRAAPKNTGEHILSFIEGVLTAEGIHADRSGREAAVASVTDLIVQSPRFEVVGVIGEDQISTSIWDNDLAADEAVDVCREWDCDLIVALDAFDSDSSILDLTEAILDADGHPVDDIVNYVARRETRLTTAWEVYDGRDGGPLDAFREVQVGNMFDAQGHTWEDALIGLPDGTSVVTGLGSDAGLDYAHRIAPLWESVDRPLYAKGSDSLEKGGDRARQGDLEGAVSEWEADFDAADGEIAGKCLYNAAVAAEKGQDLEWALALARRAESRHPAWRITAYADELQGLLAE